MSGEVSHQDLDVRTLRGVTDPPEEQNPRGIEEPVHQDIHVLPVETPEADPLKQAPPRFRLILHLL